MNELGLIKYKPNNLFLKVSGVILLIIGILVLVSSRFTNKSINEISGVVTDVKTDTVQGKHVYKPSVKYLDNSCKVKSVTCSEYYYDDYSTGDAVKIVIDGLNVSIVQDTSFPIKLTDLLVVVLFLFSGYLIYWGFKNEV